MDISKKLPSISIKVLSLYTDWQMRTKHIPKPLRFSLGTRIEQLLATLIEIIALGYYSAPSERADILMTAIAKNETLKFMFYALYELKGIDEQCFFTLSKKTEEIGWMLHGWKNQIIKQNHPDHRPSGNQTH
jgi:hypothetical protein